MRSCTEDAPAPIDSTDPVGGRGGEGVWRDGTRARRDCARATPRRGLTSGESAREGDFRCLAGDGAL